MKNYIGISADNELVFQELDSNGIIKGFNMYYAVELVSGKTVLSQSAWTHSLTLVDGSKFESGRSALAVVDMPEEFQGYRTCDTVSCDRCGAGHDSDDGQGYSSSPTWTVVNECEAVCLGCRTAEDTLVLVRDAGDFFTAKSVADVDLDAYTEVDTLFCDASGMGSESEAALTQNQAKAKVSKLISKHGPLFAGITGIGQFQVYVTLYKKTA
jgi:hypothetical protein